MCPFNTAISGKLTFTHIFTHRGQWQPIFTTFSHSFVNFCCFVWIESPILCKFIIATAVTGQWAQYSFTIVFYFAFYILHWFTKFFTDFLFLLLFLKQGSIRMWKDKSKLDCQGILRLFWVTSNRMRDGGDLSTVTDTLREMQLDRKPTEEAHYNLFWWESNGSQVWWKYAVMQEFRDRVVFMQNFHISLVISSVTDLGQYLYLRHLPLFSVLIVRFHQFHKVITTQCESRRCLLIICPVFCVLSDRWCRGAWL